MSLLKSWTVAGNDALLWHGVTYKVDVNDTKLILNKIWGAMRYGKVTAIMVSPLLLLALTLANTITGTLWMRFVSPKNFLLSLSLSLLSLPGKSTLLKVLGGQVKSGFFEGTYQKHILLRGLELVSEKVNLVLLPFFKSSRKEPLALFGNMEQEPSSRPSPSTRTSFTEPVYLPRDKTAPTRSTRRALLS
jgi:hypothetical protein